MIATIGEGQKVEVLTEVNSELQGGSSCSGVTRTGLCRRDCAGRIVAPLSADHVVGATAAAALLGPSHLSLQDPSGSSLNNLCRFSFKRPLLIRAKVSHNKRRKFAFEGNPASSSSSGGGERSSQVEVKLLGVEEEEQDHSPSSSSHVDEERPVLEQSSLESVVGHDITEEEELIHISPWSVGRREKGKGKGKGKEEEELTTHMLRRGSPCSEERSPHLVRPASLPSMHYEDSGRSFENLVLTSSSVQVRETSRDELDIGEGKGNAVVPNFGVVVESDWRRSNCIIAQDESMSLHSGSEAQLGSSSWDFKLVASVKSQNRKLISTDVIGTIAFEKSNEYFATGGIARKIRVYAYSSLLAGVVVSSDELDDEEDDDDEDSAEFLKQRRRRKRGIHATSDIDHARCCVHEVCTPAKLSSLQWHQERPNLIACGDYDGVVAEWDVEKTCAISERDENGGQRIWSIDYSKDFPDLIASASDDGTVRMWDRSSVQSVATLTLPTYSSICCAEFGPISSSLLALASADSNVYLYDTRWLSTPLLTLAHHKRAASYVRFLSRHSLVSSSIDSSVKLWDISSFGKSPPTSEHCDQPVKSYDSHYNVRNFTGLAVRAEGGLIACGSETNQAFVYDSRRSSPIFTHSFDYHHHHQNSSSTLLSSWSSDRLASKGSSNYHVDQHPEGDAADSLIVSAVCWSAKPDDGVTLVAANSDGVLRVLSGSQTSC